VNKFFLKSKYRSSGDQPNAIKRLINNLEQGVRCQVLHGVTGSGKTFTVANVIERVAIPTLVISHNKTLAAQLYQELKEFFPENAVEYFVSYYDYYQPESYIPKTDTYIEKEADINQNIEKLRLKATASLLSRNDVVVVASVSCIYNLGSPKEYLSQSLLIRAGTVTRFDLLKNLTSAFYERSDFEFTRGLVRVVGSSIDIWPSYEENPIRCEFENEKLINLYSFQPFTGQQIKKLESAVVFPAKHYLTEEKIRNKATEQILTDLNTQCKFLENHKKPLEAYRLKQKTLNDIEMIKEIGYCNGIENYSRYFDGRRPGQPPFSLLDFFPSRFLLVVDESHITIPQIRGMYNGDRSRKQTLIDYGFRLPSALDNRPLKFDEFEKRMPLTICTSATPGDWEILKSKGNVIEQFIRPTGILDPKIILCNTKDQIKDISKRIKEKVKRDERILITTLTKKMAEELSLYLEQQTKARITYLHSDIETLERTDILDKLRRGQFDVLVGVNLLREGLDLPEVSLVAIFDADKEGFLRSKTSLMQTMGRAARSLSGEIVMYADKVTQSMDSAIKEVSRQRKIQEEYNATHNIKPVKITSPFRKPVIIPELDNKIIKDRSGTVDESSFKLLTLKRQRDILKNLEVAMLRFASDLEFEKAAEIRDRIASLKK
jgi:excinuclease ABC subunit B